MKAAIAASVFGLASLLARPALVAQTPVFRSRTQVVALDVVVTDGDDKPVGGLTKDDFLITENGRPQRILEFSEIEVPAAERTVNLDAPPPPSDVASNTRSASSSRAIVIVIDDQGIDPAVLIADSLVPLRRTLTELLRQLTPDDQVAVTYMSRSDLSRDFTNDLGPLIDAINGRKAVGLPPISTYEPQRDFTATMRNVIKVLADARQTRRAVILVSPRGCVPDPPSTFGAYDCRDLIEESLTAGVPIYGIDPRLFLPPGAEINSTLKSLAAATHGIAFVGQSDTPAAVGTLLTLNGHYYLLAYSPDPAPAEGTFQNVEVTVRRPGLRVQTRRGYEMKKASSKPLTETRTMTGRLAAGLDEPGLPIRAFAAPLAIGPRNTTRTAITVELAYPLPPAEARGLKDEIRFGALALTPDAKIKGSLQRPSTYTGTFSTRASGRMLISDAMNLEPGLYTLRIGVTSQTLGKTGTTRLRLEVPDFTRKELTMSPLVIGGPIGGIDAATGLDFLRGLVPFQPILTREFAATDTLRLYARAEWKSSAIAATLGIRLTHADGTVMKTLPAESLAGTKRLDGHREVTVDAAFPLTGVAPGAYVLVTELQVEGWGTTSDKGRVLRAVPVTVR